MATLPIARAIPFGRQNQPDAVAEKARSAQLGTESTEEDHLSNLLFHDRTPLTSSNVDSAAWDEEKNLLYIWFRYAAPGQDPENATATTLYVYENVNPVDANEFYYGGQEGGIESHGVYVQRVLRKRYTGIKVGATGGGGAPIGTYQPDLTYAQYEARRRRG